MQRVFDLWNRSWNRYREIGPLYALQRIWSRLVPRWLLGAEDALIFRLDLSPLQDREKDFEEVRWATEQDSEALAAFGSNPEELYDRLQRHARAGIIERQGRVVAWNWCESGGHDQYDWLRFILGEEDIWSFDGWVAPEFRGKGLFPKVKGFMAAEYAQAGYTRMFSWIDTLNHNQQRANAQIGGRPVGRIMAVRILGLSVVRLGTSTRIGFWNVRKRLQIDVDHLCFNAGDSRQARKGSALS